MTRCSTVSPTALHGFSFDAGPLRRTSSSATSKGRRPTTRRSIERDTNRAPATGIGTRPGTATTATDGTCVVKPRRCAAATSAGPAPGPATSNAISAGRGAAIPNLVLGPFQYKPLRTRSTSPSAARRDKAHSTARRDHGNSAAVMKASKRCSSNLLANTRGRTHERFRSNLRNHNCAGASAIERAAEMAVDTASTWKCRFRTSRLSTGSSRRYETVRRSRCESRTARTHRSSRR